MRSAKQEGGSTGGRCAAASSSKGPRKQPVGRPKKANAKPRRSDEQTTCEDAIAAGLSEPLGDMPLFPFFSHVVAALFPFFRLQLPSLCSKQAEQGRKTLRFSMQCLLLEKRAP